LTLSSTRRYLKKRMGFPKNAGMRVADKPSQREQRAAVRRAAKPQRTISSRDLFGSDRLVIIRHEQEDYRLQVTVTGKLILTK
jgi:hemin uptake protein HemP